MMDETARREFLRMVASYQDRGDPTGWFDKVYRDAQGNIGAIFWADLIPNPQLVSWLEEHPVTDKGQRAVIVGCGVGDGSAAMPVPAPTATARILGNIPDGTPPPPQAPKPQFVARRADILDSKVHQQGGRTITIQRIKPIALPLPPDPAPQPLAAADPAFQEHLASFREDHPKSNMVPLGASVYHFKDAPTRTLVRYWPEGRGESITFWSSADFSLLSGIFSFVATDGETRCMFMMWGIEDFNSKADLLATLNRGHGVSNIPDFPDGPATFSIVGTPPDDPTVLVPIQSLHDLYNCEFNRLKTAWDGRERARIQRTAYLKAHPPQPKNIVLNYWRTEKTAAEKGAAR